MSRCIMHGRTTALPRHHIEIQRYSIKRIITHVACDESTHAEKRPMWQRDGSIMKHDHSLITVRRPELEWFACCVGGGCRETVLRTAAPRGQAAGLPAAHRVCAPSRGAGAVPGRERGPARCPAGGRVLRLLHHRRCGAPTVFLQYLLSVSLMTT
eukprot:COSAG05_NODE_3453_length_2051_cov_67.970287_2_plen_155_part_00